MMPTAMSRAAYDKRRRRRWLLRAVIAMSLGLATTVAAAWACAFWSPSSRLVTAVLSADQPSYETGIGVKGTIHWRQMGGGTHSIETGSGGLMCGDDSTTYTVQGLPPPPVLTTAERRMGFGWPLPAMSYRLVEHGTYGIFSDMRLVGGISGPKGSNWRGLSGRNLPLTLQPAGFAVNTLIVALLVFLLLGGWSDVRAFLRARRGLCPRCAYDSRGLAQCPECGLESSSRATTHLLPDVPLVPEARP